MLSIRLWFFIYENVLIKVPLILKLGALCSPVWLTFPNKMRNKDHLCDYRRLLSKYMVKRSLLEIVYHSQTSLQTKDACLLTEYIKH